MLFLPKVNEPIHSIYITYYIHGIERLLSFTSLQAIKYKYYIFFYLLNTIVLGFERVKLLQPMPAW